MVPLVEEGKRHTSERASVAYHRMTQGRPPRCPRVGPMALIMPPMARDPFQVPEALNGADECASELPRPMLEHSPTIGPSDPTIMRAPPSTPPLPKS